MSISLAIDNIVSTVNDLATVISENQEHGNVDYQLTIMLDEQSNEYYHGATKNIQHILLELSAMGNIPIAEIAAKCKSISDALAVDRRRGGNAQTTVIGPWVKNEDEGREGIVLESTIEVHTYGS